MLTKLKKQFVLYRCGLLQTIYIILGIWACSFLLACGIMYFAKPDTYVNLGVLFAIVFGSMFLILLYSTNYCVEFELALKMSVPRKTFLIYNTALNLASGIIYGVLICAIIFADSLFSGVLFKYVPLDNEMFILIPPLYMIGIMFLINAAAIIAGMFIGAMLQRFGKKAFWAMWGLYMFIFVGGAGFSVASENPNSFIGKIAITVQQFIGSLNSYAIIALIAAAVLAVAAASVLMLRRATVKS